MFARHHYTEYTRPPIDGSMFTTAPAGFVGRMRVSLQSVVNHAKIPQQCLDDILKNNIGQQAYVVAATILVIEALRCAGAVKVAEKISHTPIASFDLLNISNIETVARCSTHLEGCAGGYPNYKHPLVGRFKTVLGRDLTSHDVEAELHARATPSVPHSWCVAHDHSDQWHRQLYMIMLKFFQSAVAEAPAMLQDANSWWKTRAVWLGSGSSSSKEKLLLPKIYSIDSRARLTKSAVLSNAPSDYLHKTLEIEKPIMICRSATKNEPGLKKRPLRAADDRSYIVAAFASNNMEKHLSIDGVVMRQTPTDIQETTINIIASAKTPKQYILCIDYSDFNMTHTTRARALLNLALAVTYKKYKHEQQAAASLWIAIAQLNHYIDGQISNQGLSSGERDTARDNAILHYCYQTLVCQQAAATFQHWRSANRLRICGDDEICVGMKWSDIITYCNLHQLQGHKIQFRKVMVSKNCGEFLQYNMHGNGTIPTQPLIPNIVNFVSGSWYKSSNYQHSHYAEQISDAAASCIRRGAAPKTMMMLCAASCNWLMDGEPWREALMATNLFGATNQKPPTSHSSAVVETESVIGEHKTVGVNDYTAILSNKYNLNPKEKALIARYATKQIYSGLITDLKLNIERLDGQPMLKTLTLPEIAVTQLESLRLCKAWLLARANTRMDQKVWMAVQLGVPPALVEQVGAELLLKAANNATRAHFQNNIPTIMQMPVAPRLYSMLPGGLVPYFTCV
jgi:hypothetical protein